MYIHTHINTAHTHILVNEDRIVIFGLIFRSVSIRSDHNAFQCVITHSFHKYCALTDQITQKQIGLSMVMYLFDLQK